jgi:4-hydroxy-tetrahydrodipicolinate reductase
MNGEHSAMSGSKVIRAGVLGASGRMGRAVVDAAGPMADLEIVAQFGRPDPAEAREAALANCDVIIEFSNAAASAELAAWAAANGGPALVIGSTGVSASEDAAIERAARIVPIVKSGNYSIGVNVLAGLVEQAARRLGPEAWDIEVLEAHHRRKVDAPSGTALMLAEAAARARGRPLADIRSSPEIAGPRAVGDIGFAVLRGGGIVGEHSVVFAAEDEIITLSHSARDRRLFARGALRAAVWVAGRAPGLYDMMEVLGFGAGWSEAESPER